MPPGPPYVPVDLMIELFDTVYFLSSHEVVYLSSFIACALVALFILIKRS